MGKLFFSWAIFKFPGGAVFQAGRSLNIVRLTLSVKPNKIARMQSAAGDKH